MSDFPNVRPEPAQTRSARQILAHLASAPHTPMDLRLAVLEAVGDLDEHLPVGHVLASVIPAPGTVSQAVGLLAEAATAPGLPVGDKLAAARAAARLRRPWAGEDR